MKKTPGIEQGRPEPRALGEELRNRKARGAKPPTGQPKEGPQRYDDEAERPTVGRINDGIADKGPIK